jgi:predicted unusual protein kinase regulating ubiquinone biosynthesis (AarF/ABC1/UbiB family)
VTRGELHWECNYSREAEIQREYRKKLLISPEKFYCPKVVDKLSNRELLCTEFVEGVEIDTLMHESQEVRDRVGSLMIELCFRELFEWKMM